MNFALIFPTFLLGILLVVSVTKPTASIVFAIKGGIPNGGNSANAPSPNDQALANACANTAGKPNQPPFCVSVPPPIDSDGDGIPDDSDPCPGDPNNTCTTDSDGDGIPDESDPCPGDPTNNCPRDSDGDGLPDESDPCPTDPTNTCSPPDSDNDGLPDRSDPCPFDPTNTCVPIDSDRDGIPDYADECPTDPTNTCDQDIDSDMDGINDEFDPCPFDPTNNLAEISIAMAYLMSQTHVLLTQPILAAMEYSNNN